MIEHLGVDDQSADTKTSQLERVIANIQQNIPELDSVLIATVDGLPLAHNFDEAAAEQISAMAASAQSVGKRIAQRGQLGDLGENVIRGEAGYFVVYSAGDEAVLVMSGPITSNLGLMRIEARVAAIDIKAALGVL